MTEWEKLKVVELKEQCKSRDISITGLKLKQQYIDKLVEYESTSQDATLAEESVEDRTNGAPEEVEEDEAPDTIQAPTPSPKDDVNGEQNNDTPEVSSREDTPVVTAADEKSSQDRPATPKGEESRDSVEKAEDDIPMADVLGETKETKKSDMLIPEQEQIDVQEEAVPEQQDSIIDPGQDASMDDVEAEMLEQLAKEPTPTPIIDDPMVDGRDVTPPSEELRKRKRRSATPPPMMQESRKRAKGDDGAAIIPDTVSVRSSSQSPARLGAAEHQDLPAKAPETISYPVEESVQEQSTSADDVKVNSPTLIEDDDKVIGPAIHVATRSLYMRNFKRPLNVPTLRSHVLSIAKGASSTPQDEEVIKFWYMNNIRSHAFVTFANISAASRVRTAMHHTRFPDEPQREALWIDFVPDEKVESWVDQETGSSRGQRNSGSKFEVVYNDTKEGFEAVFQEIGAARDPPQRPSISAAATNQPSLSQRQPSHSTDPTRTATVASGVHPDRAALVPQSEERHRRSSPPALPTPAKPHADQGKGFEALDDLFSSTTVKPKLYYKKVAQDIIDSRLDMIQDLFPDRGVSGDAGMKRFTLESQSGREKWVDNGPEFGHGKRGQDRLAGIGGRGRGGFRGRGGRGGGGGDGRFYGGDSYRGGGRR